MMKHYPLRPFLLILVGLASALVATPRAAAYTNDSNIAGAPCLLSQTTTNYCYSVDAALIPGVQDAFNQWSADLNPRPYLQSNLDFVDGGSMSVEGGVNDGFYHIGKALTDDELAIVGDGLATTVVYTNEANKIIDADVILASTVTAANFTATGEAGKTPIQPILTHEVGHMIGLNHSAILSASMYPRLATATADPNSDATVNLRATLDYDDKAAVWALYNMPGYEWATGRIAGRVTQGGKPVYGAHVVAVNQSNGLIFGGNVTPGDNQGAQSGAYEIRFLPVGTYKVYAEPNDGPLTQDDWNGNYAAGSTWGGAFTQHYRTTYYNNGTGAVSVDINNRAQAGIDIAVTAVTDSATMKPCSASFTAGNPQPVPLVVKPGDPARTAYLFGTQTDDYTGLTLTCSDSSIAFSDLYSGVSSGLPGVPDGTKYVSFTVTVPSSGLLGGPRNIQFAKPSGEVAVYTGGLYIEAPGYAIANNSAHYWEGLE